MEEASDTVVETREEVMISPSGEGNPILRRAHFLKPSITSIKGPVFNIPSDSLPPTFEPKKCPLTVKFNGWRNPPMSWKAWVGKMAALHESTWKKAGIYEAILNSKYIIRRNYDLLLGVAERWCSETKSFIFPWGEATVTLEDMMASGYSVLGSPVFSPLEMEELKVIEDKLIQKRKEVIMTTARKACQHTWMKMFMNSGSEIEHEAFIALWLSRFVLPISSSVIRECIFRIAVHLARGTRIALAPAVLASIYRDLSLLKGKIVTLTTLETNNPDKDKDDDELAVILGSPFQLVQVWVWERFVELQPRCNLVKKNEPRLAQWDKVQCKVKHVRLILDSAKENFNWRPYAKTMENLDFPKLYGENERCVPINLSFDEELMSFARCVRVSLLVGLDSIEQYLPHRVAMQFGIDQDLPGCVGQSHGSPEIAWSDYSRPIGDVNFYVPSRLFKTGITTRYMEWWKQWYMEWWKQSMLGFQGARMGAVQQEKISMGVQITSKGLKEKKKNEFFSSFKITQRGSKGKEARSALKRFNIASKRFEGMQDDASFSSFRVSPRRLNGVTKDDSFISSFKMIPKCSKQITKDDGASTNPGFPSKKLETLAEIPKWKNNCSDASIAFGNPLKQSKIPLKSPKGKEGGYDVSASPVFSQQSLKELGESSERKKEEKDATVPHVTPLKISNKSVLNSKGCDEFTLTKPQRSLKRKNEENEGSASKTAKTSSLSFIAMINNSLVPPGFPPKFHGVEARDSIEEENTTSAKTLNFCGKHEDVEQTQSRVVQNSLGQSQNHLSSVEEINPTNAEMLEFCGKHKHGQSGAAENLSGQSRNHSSYIEENNSNTAQMFRQSEAVENRQGFEDETSSCQPEGDSSSIFYAGAPRNLDSVKTLVEKVSEDDMGGSERPVEDANPSNAGSPAHRTLSSNGTGETSTRSYTFEPWLKLEARISRLERKAAKLKAARFGKNG